MKCRGYWRTHSLHWSCSALVLVLVGLCPLAAQELTTEQAMQLPIELSPTHAMIPIERWQLTTQLMQQLTMRLEKRLNQVATSTQLLNTSQEALEQAYKHSQQQEAQIAELSQTLLETQILRNRLRRSLLAERMATENLRMTYEKTLKQITDQRNQTATQVVQQERKVHSLRKGRWLWLAVGAVAGGLLSGFFR